MYHKRYIDGDDMTYRFDDDTVELTIEQESKRMNDEIIDRLIAYRKKLNMTQQDVADATGIQRANIARMESKKSMSSVENLRKYARSLGIELRFEMVHPEKPGKRRPLPVGCSDFRRVSEESYYVDKTMLIKDILDKNIPVSLFTRPRRFGKTLNMDMLRVFFEDTEEDTSVYFMDKKIWKCGEHYCRHQGQYPVISLTFKDVKYATWEESLNYLRFIFAVEYNRHPELIDSEKCNAFEKKHFGKVVAGEATEMDLVQSLFFLTQMLHKHYGVAPIIMIDEYDCPIQQGHMHGYYERAVNFIRNLFSVAFKDNSHLSYGFLTGILRVAKESIFSGLNNIKVNSILDEDYSEYFGFTPDEVKQMAEYYDSSDKYDEICTWYDGYRFGDSHIFNPWSVINYFNSSCNPQAYWVSTSSNDIISEIIENATPEIQKALYRLLQGEAVYTSGDTSVIYPNIKKSPNSVFSFLLVAGYLKIADVVQLGPGRVSYQVAIPNAEISSIYQKEILSKLEQELEYSFIEVIQNAMTEANVSELQTQLQEFLLQTVSYYDTANEGFYHGFMLGVCAMFRDAYDISSNRESGAGRFDIQMFPKKVGLPGILIELKSLKTATDEQLIHVAQEALEQIEFKKYDTGMKEKGVTPIVKYGVAFSGKQVQVIYS